MISVVVCSVDAGRIHSLRENLAATMGSNPWELVHIHDARSLAEGYQRGIAACRGDILVLCHDDVEILSPDFPRRLQEHLAHFDLIGVAGTSRLCSGYWLEAGAPYLFGQVANPANDNTFNVQIYGAPRPVVGNIQALDGLWMAGQRSLFERVHFDAACFDAFHLYDVDFSFSAYKTGLRLGVVNDIQLLHRSPGQFDDVWEKYKLAFDRKWAGQLAPSQMRRFMWAAVKVNTLAEVLEVMNPPYWNDASPATAP